MLFQLAVSLSRLWMSVRRLCVCRFWHCFAIAHPLLLGFCRSVALPINSCQVSVTLLFDFARSLDPQNVACIVPRPCCRRSCCMLWRYVTEFVLLIESLPPGLYGALLLCDCVKILPWLQVTVAGHRVAGGQPRCLSQRLCLPAPWQQE